MRILVLGTSHAACLRDAFPAIHTVAPELDLTFWGLPGGAFQKARVGEDGILRPDPSDRVGKKKVAAWNTATEIDLAPFDRIFLVGLRFGLNEMLRQMAELQPVDWGPRKGAVGVSTGFLRAAFEASALQSLAAQAERIPLDARFILMPAPYPAVLSTQISGPRYEPNLHRAAELERAADLMEMAEAAMRKVHSERGLGFVTQPRDTLAAPLLSRDDLLQDAAQDARHMNSHYGLIAFQALLATLSKDELSRPAAAAAKRA
ncbi:hypothetical protein ACSBLW_07965 [Thioclava sp. FR2]|uniref:hypothetical protein n=1 Tax=Thioclava sp. FR2 TaxID=3445780 RepID=UPI003EBBC1E3